MLFYPTRADDFFAHQDGFFLAVFSINIAAQTSGRAITGIVNDASGASVPNATVALLSPAGKQVETTSSASDGSFRLPASKLSDGQLQIQCNGFKPFVLHLDLSRKLEPLVAVLQLSDVHERVDVSVSADADQVSTDPAQNRDATVLNDNMLEQLPVFDQDYIGAVSNFLDQGAGGNMGTTIVVDGMEQKDAGVTPSAVQSVKINNDPYSAEFSRPGRGRIEITTKTPDPSTTEQRMLSFGTTIWMLVTHSPPPGRQNSGAFLKAFSPARCRTSAGPFFFFPATISRTMCSPLSSRNFLPGCCGPMCRVLFGQRISPLDSHTISAINIPACCSSPTKAARVRTS